MRIYLAAPSREMPRARLAAEQIRAAGHELTSRWHETDVPPSDSPINRELAVAAWEENRRGLVHADRVVALACTGGGLSQGVREEAVYRLAVGEVLDECDPRALVIVGDPGPSLALASVHRVGSLEEALA